MSRSLLAVIVVLAAVAVLAGCPKPNAEPPTPTPIAAPTAPPSPDVTPPPAAATTPSPAATAPSAVKLTEPPAAPKPGNPAFPAPKKLAADHAVQPASASHKTSDQHAVVYTCPMHPEVTSSTPGKCPKCHMNLEKKG